MARVAQSSITITDVKDGTKFKTVSLFKIDAPSVAPTGLGFNTSTGAAANATVGWTVAAPTITGTQELYRAIRGILQLPGSSVWAVDTDNDWVIALASGVRGEEGAQGDEGAQGAQGLQGEEGAQGLQGLQGGIGLQGAQGDVGAQGLQGLQGGIGLQGAQGLQGLQGGIGLQGAQGGIGLQGAQGGIGLQGAQGLQGLQGGIGLQGAQGEQGVVGAAGATIAFGTTGTAPPTDAVKKSTIEALKSPAVAGDVFWHVQTDRSFRYSGSGTTFVEYERLTKPQSAGSIKMDGDNNRIDILDGTTLRVRIGNLS